MLRLEIPGGERFDEATNTFITDEPIVLELEHSLAVLSKWESIWKKPFLALEDKTTEMVVSYIECMIQGSNFPRGILARLNQGHLEAINDYINDPMTATWFNELPQPGASSEVITSELIYFWMHHFNIPTEYDQWHLNRLFTVIKVHNAKNQPEKKRSASEISRSNAELNARRRKEFNTKG